MPRWFEVTYDQAVWERACGRILAESAEEAEELVMSGHGEVVWHEADQAVEGISSEVQGVQDVEEYVQSKGQDAGPASNPEWRPR